MGGDCDGNLNVIVDIICYVLLFSCWKVIDLFLKDIQVLVFELLMVEVIFELLVLVGEEGVVELYCYLMKNLCFRLMVIQVWLEVCLKGEELLKLEGLLI